MAAESVAHPGRNLRIFFRDAKSGPERSRLVHLFWQTGALTAGGFGLTVGATMRAWAAMAGGQHLTRALGRLLAVARSAIGRQPILHVSDVLARLVVVVGSIVAFTPTPGPGAAVTIHGTRFGSTPGERRRLAGPPRARSPSRRCPSEIAAVASAIRPRAGDAGKTPVE